MKYKKPTKQYYAKAKQARIINRFERAVEALAFKGSQPPDEHEEIVQEYKEARAKLVEAMSNLTPPGSVMRGGIGVLK